VVGKKHSLLGFCSHHCHWLHHCQHQQREIVFDVVDVGSGATNFCSVLGVCAHWHRFCRQLQHPCRQFHHRLRLLGRCVVMLVIGSGCSGGPGKAAAEKCIEVDTLWGCLVRWRWSVFVFLYE